MSNAKDNLSRLLSIMAQLRDPKNGCPWDKQQTFETIAPYTIEEAYEVADAILNGDRASIKDECGDLLFQVVFYAQLGKEEGAFEFDDIAKAICDKLVRRHPHVFEQQQTMSDQALSAQWERLKSAERTPRNGDNFFQHIPKGLSGLKFAEKTQKACSKVGFDWDSPGPVLNKIKEEVEEIAQELHKEEVNAKALEEEIGDAFFALVNFSRHCKVDADNALRKATIKFQQRFNAVEQMAKACNLDIEDASLEQMEAWWTLVKNQQRSK